MNPLTIIKAWVKVYKGTTTAEDKRRYEICRKCEHAKYKSYLDFVDDDLKDVKGFICNLCKCPLVAKIRSKDKCNKW